MTKSLNTRLPDIIVTEPKESAKLSRLQRAKPLVWDEIRGTSSGGRSLCDELIEDRRLERERELREEGW